MNQPWPVQLSVWKRGEQPVEQHNIGKVDVVRSGDGEVAVTVAGEVGSFNCRLHRWEPGEYRLWMLVYRDDKTDCIRSLAGMAWCVAKVFTDDGGWFAIKAKCDTVEYPVVRLDNPALPCPANLFETAREA